MPISLNTQVRQVTPTIVGEVQARRFNEDASCMEYLVAYTADGESHQRWFLETQIQEVL